MRCPFWVSASSGVIAEPGVQLAHGERDLASRAASCAAVYADGVVTSPPTESTGRDVPWA
jgi:hypothetical protein